MRAGWPGRRGVLALVFALVVVLAALVGYFAPIGGIEGSPDGLGSSLRWHVINPPPGQKNPFQVEVSPADGHVAWACGLVAPGTFAVWRTTDAGLSWRQVGTVKPPMPDGSAKVACQLHADPGDTANLALDSFTNASMPGGNAPQGITYLSTDGGASWHALAGHSVLLALASNGRSTFAILAKAEGPVYDDPHLIVSTDGMRTWRDVVKPGSTPSPAVVQLFSAPGAQGVIAMVGNDLVHISSDGAAWMPITPPPDISYVSDIPLVTWLTASHEWMICDAASMGAANEVCITDGGHTWSTRPLLPNPWMCPSCHRTPVPAVSGGMCLPNALASDGALLALCWTKIDPAQPDGEPGSSANPGHLYRLGLGATSWTDLGVMGGGVGEPRVYGQVVWDMGGPALWVADLSALPA